RHQPARRLHEPAARQARDDVRQTAVQDGTRRRLPVDMRSIGSRMSVWYASAATVTLACLFVAGYLLLENQLIHGLDLLNEAGFKQIEAHLGADYRTLDAASIETRIREITDDTSTLFYVDVHVHEKGTIFRSTNLTGHNIPDVPGLRRF